MYPKKKVKYKVTNAKTERYKNLPIISMQNLLNSEYKRNVNLCKNHRGLCTDWCPTFKYPFNKMKKYKLTI